MIIGKFSSAAATVAIVASAMAFHDPVEGKPRMTQYSVTCADGTEVSGYFASVPDGFTMCIGHGYNGGVIKARPAVLDTKAQANIGASAVATAVRSDDQDAASAAATGETTLAGRPRPSDSNGNGGGEPGVQNLSCAKGASGGGVINLSTGLPFWTLTAPNGQVAAITPVSQVSWSAVPGGQWVGPAGGSTNAAPGNYLYSVKVHIAKCPAGTPTRLDYSYRSDNVGTLMVDGVTVQNQAGTANYGFLPASMTTGSYAFPAGTSGFHTVTLQVFNQNGPSGVSANMSLHH